MKRRWIIVFFLAVLAFPGCAEQSAAPWRVSRVIRSGGPLKAEIAYPQLLPQSQYPAANRLLEQYGTADARMLLGEEAWVEGGYRVARNDSGWFSVAFAGSYYAADTPHPTATARALTFRMPQGERVRLQDIASLDGVFLSALKEAVQNHKNRDAAEYWSRFTAPEWMALLLSSDRDETAPVFSFLRADALVLVVPVPHPLGDVAEIDLPLALADKPRTALAGAPYPGASSNRMGYQRPFFSIAACLAQTARNLS